MNKILVIKNKIEKKDNDIEISDNKITFKENGDYLIDYIDCDEVNIDIYLKENTTIKLFEYSNNHDISFHNHYFLEKNTNLLLFKFGSNNNTCEEIIFDLNDVNAKLNYQFRSIATNYDVHKLIINHNSKNTSSYIVNRSIAKENARIDFTVDSYLAKNMKGCHLDQDTKIITLGDNNSIIRPNMYISEVDVEARHASSIGNFSYDDIFYLMTRGISYQQCLKLLIKGFILGKFIVDIKTREKILKIINDNWR